jgi:serine/threonine protein kinase
MASPLGSGARACKASGPLAPGDVVGRYRICKELGAGAMGVVYLADDQDLDRRAAVKVLRGQAANTSARLLREAQALARIAHPNVIVVYEVGTFEQQVFMAMEFVEGSSLAAWLEATRRTSEEILEAFVQAGRGLAVAHAAGLVHRDFKPDNVLVGRDGRIRVLDFGLALNDAVVSPAEPAASSEDVDARRALLRLTRTDVFVGTPVYMAPEQFDGELADARTDQFGFCVALYEALFGERPFAADTLDELVRAVKSGVVRAPRSSRVSRRVEQAIVRGLRVRPADRFPSMDALLAELSPKPRKVGLVQALAAGVVALALASSLAVYARMDRAEARRASESAPLPSSTTVSSGPPVASTPESTARAVVPVASPSAAASSASAVPPSSAAPAARRVHSRSPASAPRPLPSGPLMPTTP